MYLTREAAAYMRTRRSRPTSRSQRPQGDLPTTDCKESIIGLIIVAVARRRRGRDAAEITSQDESKPYTDGRRSSTPSRPTLGAGGVTQILGDLVSKTRGCACQPLEDDGVAAHSTHPPTYRWEPDGVVDLLGTTAPPHNSIRRLPAASLYTTPPTMPRTNGIIAPGQSTTSPAPLPSQ